jgi:nucleoside 2-deoxyribosyltransferase
MDKTGIKIYLAGPFTKPDWRDRIINEVPQHTYFDPRRNEQSACVTIVRDDLILGVENSDIVFSYFPKGNNDIGTCIEMGNAFGKRKIIVLVNENLFLHPLISGIAKRQFSSLEAGIIYLNNLKSIEQSEEFVAAYKTIDDLAYTKPL